VPLRPYIGTPGEYRREAEIYLERAKNLHKLAERDPKAAQFLLDIAEALTLAAEHANKVQAYLVRPMKADDAS
jgi:hypothetical protein